MRQVQIEKKVEDYLRNSQALDDYWQRPITPDQLQAEMERIASHTKQPGVLREIFAALDNDPFVIAECLARPVLAERLVNERRPVAKGVSLAQPIIGRQSKNPSAGNNGSTDRQLHASRNIGSVGQLESVRRLH